MKGKKLHVKNMVQFIL